MQEIYFVNNNLDCPFTYVGVDCGEELVCMASQSPGGRKKTFPRRL